MSGGLPDAGWEHVEIPGRVGSAFLAANRLQVLSSDQ